MSILSRNGRTALRYATELGWAVLPLTTNTKRPLGLLAPKGVYSATTDLEIIERWWRREPEAGVGIATGPASGGLVVIDADGPVGLASAEALELPDTVTVVTRRGKHWYYQSDRLRRSSSGRLAKKIDVQVTGSYVAAPPTEIDGKRYRWRRSAFHRDVEPLPTGIEQALHGTVSPRSAAQISCETVPGGGDQSRSGLDAQRTIRLVQSGLGRGEVLAAFGGFSEKFIERAARRGDEAAESYFESVYGWALRFAGANHRLAKVVRAQLEVLGAAGGRSALGRILLELTADDGGAVSHQLVVPTGSRSDEMWQAATPDLDPVKVMGPGGHRIVRALEGRVFDVVLRGCRVVWMRTTKSSWNLHTRSAGNCADLGKQR